MIFDMDGVLIDSEPAYLDMVKNLCKELKVDMEDSEYQRFVGMSAQKMWTIIQGNFKLSNEVEELVNMEKNLMTEILRSSIISSPMEGIVELLDILKKKEFIITLASSSAKKNINIVLKRLDLGKYFEFVVSGEEVDRGKPEPDIFLKVSEKFNIPITNCYVFEDSLNGILAAKSAGMKCIGFKNNNTNHQDLSKSDLTIQSFNETDRKKVIKFIESN